MKTIARNRTKLINEIFASVKTCHVFNRHNYFQAEECAPERARKALDSIGAKLVDNGNGEYTVQVHQGFWFNLDTNAKEVAVVQVAEATTEEQPAATQEPLVVPAYATVAQRRTLGDTRVTLDGKPARITGFLMPFAQVQSDDDSVEFAWGTVAHVVACGGNFFSNPDKAREARRPKSARENRIAAIQDALESTDSVTLAKIAELLKLA